MLCREVEEEEEEEEEEEYEEEEEEEEEEEQFIMDDNCFLICFLLQINNTNTLCEINVSKSPEIKINKNYPNVYINTITNV